MPDRPTTDSLNNHNYQRIFLNVLRTLLVLILLGFAVHLLLPQIAEVNNSVQVIKGMIKWLLGLAIISEILSYAGSGYMIKKLVGIADQQISLINGMIITLAAAFIGIFAGGVVGSAAAVNRWLRIRGINREGSLMAGWLPPLFNDASLAFVSFFGVAHLLASHELTTLEAIGFGLTLVTLGIVIAIVAWGMYHRSRFTDLLIRLNYRWTKFRNHPFEPTRYQAIAERFFETWDTMISGGWRGPTVGAVLNITFDLVALYILFAAAGHPINPGILLTGYGLPLLLSRVTFLPGGVGIVEGTMVAIYSGMGVPGSISVVVVLAYRMISFWVPTLLGIPTTIYLERKKSLALM